MYWSANEYDAPTLPILKFLVVGLIQLRVTPTDTFAALRSAAPPPLALPNEAPLCLMVLSLILLRVRVALAWRVSEEYIALKPVA